MKFIFLMNRHDGYSWHYKSCGCNCNDIWFDDDCYHYQSTQIGSRGFIFFHYVFFFFKTCWRKKIFMHRLLLQFYRNSRNFCLLDFIGNLQIWILPYSGLRCRQKRHCGLDIDERSDIYRPWCKYQYACTFPLFVISSCLTSKYTVHIVELWLFDSVDNILLCLICASSITFSSRLT